MLESLKALRSALNVGAFPDGVEEAAKSVLDKLNLELEAEQYEEGIEVVSATEGLNMALDEVAASADEDEDDDDDEELDEVDAEEDEEIRSN